MMANFLKQIFQRRKTADVRPPTPLSYLDEYYNSYIWKHVQYHGIRTLKFVPDLWNYQEIIFERRIDYVIETGTRHGGSALFFADTLAARNKDGLVISIDVADTDRQVKADERIHFLIGDSSSVEIANKIEALLPESRRPGSTFWILDSDHSKGHVLAELNRLVPLMKSGDYLIVEDTCINGHSVRPEFGPGPWEAVEQYKQNNPDALLADKVRETKFLYSFAPNGFYIRK